MPEPVTTSEILLQQIADRLASIDAKLDRQVSVAPAAPVVAKKSPAKKPSVRKVDGR